MKEIVDAKGVVKPVTIANRVLGAGMNVFVIAELGSNHDRSLRQAKEAIDAAAEAGCDAIKFQLLNADRMYQRNEPAHALMRANEFPREWLPELVDYCKAKGILFAATPFDAEAVDLLRGIGVPFIKIASPEIHDLPLIRYATRCGLPLIISTGMATITDISYALQAVREEQGKEVVLLHCVSLYPTAPQHAHLRMMIGMAHAFGVDVGLSDHSQSLAIPAAAVALGACVIEKHFTLSRALRGPDHGYALEPHELKTMVKGIREVEVALGSLIKEPIYGEENLSLNNKSLISRVAISKGTSITEEVLTVRRAKAGIRPLHMEIVVGRTAKIDIPVDEVITWEML